MDGARFHLAGLDLEGATGDWQNRRLPGREQEGLVRMQKRQMETMKAQQREEKEKRT